MQTTEHFKVKPYKYIFKTKLRYLWTIKHRHVYCSLQWMKREQYHGAPVDHLVKHIPLRLSPNHSGLGSSPGALCCRSSPFIPWLSSHSIKYSWKRTKIKPQKNLQILLGTEQNITINQQACHTKCNGLIHIRREKCLRCVDKYWHSDTPQQTTSRVATYSICSVTLHIFGYPSSSSHH